MKIKCFLLASTLTFAGSVFASDVTVATYKGGKITEQNVMSMLKAMPNSEQFLSGKTFKELPKNMQEEAIKAYANKTLLVKAAKDAKIESSDLFNQKLKDIKQELAMQIYIEKYLNSKISQELIKKEYEKEKEKLLGKEEVNISQIFVKSEAAAKAIEAKLNKGAKFADLAEKQSKENGNKGMNGNIGYVVPSDIPILENDIDQLKIGQFSKPIKTEAGYHILYVNDKRKVKIPSFDEAKNSIKKQLQAKFANQLMEDVAKKADLKILD